MCCLCYPKQTGQPRSIWVLPKMLSMVQLSLQIKYWAKIATGMIFNRNFRRNKNSIVMLKKGCWLSMCNKVKPEQHFTAVRPNTVAVFQASLKLIREEVGAQLPNKDNKYSTSHGSKHLCEEGAVNKLAGDRMIWSPLMMMRLKTMKKQNNKYHLYANPVQP